MTTVSEWLELMAPVAYGALALKPWEFGALTPGEFQQLVDGYVWRTRQQQIAAASLVAPIINTCTSHVLKKPVTVDMLLGLDTTNKKCSTMTKEKAKSEIAKLMAKVG